MCSSDLGVRDEQSHLPCCIATIRAASIGLDKLTNSKAIRGFFGRDGDVLAHQCFPSRLGDVRGSRNASIPYQRYSRPTPEYFNPPREPRIVRHAVVHHPAGFGVVGDCDRFLLGVVRDDAEHEAKKSLPRRASSRSSHSRPRAVAVDCAVVIRPSDAIEIITTHYIERAFVESHGRGDGHYLAH